MRVLYVGSGAEGSTNEGRIDGLRRAGWDVRHLDSDPWVKHARRWWRGIHNRAQIGPLIWRFNRIIRREARSTSSRVVWIDKGIWVAESTVRSLQSEGRLAVHYTPDPAIAFHQTRPFMASLAKYDLLFTTKEWELPLYRHHGAKSVKWIRKCVNHRTRRPIQLNKEEARLYGCDLVFAGHAERHYEQTISTIAEQLPGIKIKVWGPWERAVRRNLILGPLWQGRGAYGDEYAKALSGAKIGLGLLTKLVPETETARTYEIPACRCFLLAERTDAHQRDFREGEEAEFFGNSAELLDKIKYYLSHPRERKRVAHAGYERVMSARYTTEHAMAECVKEVERLIAQRNDVSRSQ